jgi:hypothetical protein
MLAIDRTMSQIFHRKIRLPFPLTTKYGDEGKPSGQQWEKMDLGRHLANVLLN